MFSLPSAIAPGRTTRRARPRPRRPTTISALWLLPIAILCAGCVTPRAPLPQRQLLIELPLESSAPCPRLPETALEGQPPLADAAGAAEFLRGRVGSPEELAVAYARLVQFVERLHWAERDAGQEEALSLCSARAQANAARIIGHNARATRLNQERD